MVIETEFKCPKCGTIMDCKRLKELIANLITEFINKI